MGLLDKILGRDCEWYLQKAKTAAAESDFGQAMDLAEKGIELAKEKGSSCDDLHAFHDEVRTQVLQQALERAKSFIRAGNDASAQNCLDLALRHANTDEEKALIEDVVQNSHAFGGEVLQDAQVKGADEVSSLAFEDKWALLVTALPFAQAEAYDELGTDFKRAWVDLQEGKLESAISGLQKSLEENPENVHVMIELGRALYAKGEFKEAEKLLTKADHMVQNVGVKLLRTEVLWAMQRFDIAELVLQKAHDLEPENNQVLASIAQHGLLAKDYESGIPAIEALIEALPGDYSVWKLAGRLYLESGDENKALDCFERVNQLFWKVDPQTKKLQFDPLSVNTAAGLYLKKGENTKRAIELLDALRANTAGADHIAICIQMAQAYDSLEEEGRRNELLDEAERFFEDTKNEDPVMQALKELCRKVRAGEMRVSQAK